MQNVLTTCAYCGCGCGLYLHEENGKIVGSTPSRNHPVSRNNLCVKGWHLHEFIHNPDRLTEPLIKKKGKFVPASWDEAFAYAAGELDRIRKFRGGAALGILSSAKCTNEENYLLQKFARVVLKTNNIDHCARL
jgi:predicted molibdopterin-dependent oxidoreductase YjgC